MIFFLRCALLAIAKRRWLAAGIFISLTTLVWQPAFVVGLAATAVAVIALPGERLKALARVTVGGL